MGMTREEAICIAYATIRSARDAAERLATLTGWRAITINVAPEVAEAISEILGGKKECAFVEEQRCGATISFLTARATGGAPVSQKGAPCSS